MATDQDEKLEAISDLLGGKPGDFCRDWMEAVEQAGDEEKSWRTDKAVHALKAFKGDPTSNVASFNIYHSNIETLVPALYNSSPIPDVRRRFLDEDKIASSLSTIIERSLSFSIDDYDFDDVMRSVVKDMATVDRGIAWVMYEPTFGQDGNVVYEEALCELIDWEQFRRGPAKQWAKVPWIARARFLERTEIIKLLQKQNNIMRYDEETMGRILADLKFAHNPESKTDSNDKTTPRFGKREMVWEIWDKDTKQVMYISQDYTDMPICVMKDPLGLKGFFPTPRPAMIITTTDSLVPITTFEIYCDLIETLNDLTDRIDHLVDQIRVRGGYAGVVSQVERIAKADDGELVPLDNAESYATAGGDLNKIILWWPLEMIYKALEVLVQQREVVKATIYEVTGLSDIIRGATDPNETATAQGIKEKWGSIRVQSHQKEVERYARDLFRLKAEIFCKHFALPTLLQISGVRLPTMADKQRAEAVKAKGQQMLQQYQAQGGDISQLPQELKDVQKQIEDTLAKPSQEEVEQLMRDDTVRRYRVDVESDSTVRADLTKSQEQMKGFLDGTAAYLGAVGPLVKDIPSFGPPAVKIYAAFTRNFRLGKIAEDAIDEFAESIDKNGVQGPPPDPTVAATAAKLEAEAEKTRTESSLLVPEFQRETAKTRADIVMQARGQEHAENSASQDFELRRRDASVQANDRAEERGLKHLQAADQNRQFDRQMEDNRDARAQEDSHFRIGLSDQRAQRGEGYAMAAQQQPTEFDPEGKRIERPPIIPPEMGDLDEFMTLEEKNRLASTDQLMQGLLQGLQQIAQAQAQQSQATQEALDRLTQAIMAPKQIVRDQSGRPQGLAPAEGV